MYISMFLSFYTHAHAHAHTHTHFVLTFTLAIFATRFGGRMIFPPGRYSPIIPELDEFHATMSYPSMGSPLPSNPMSVPLTLRLTFLISLNSCGNRYDQTSLRGYTNLFLYGG